MVAALLSSRTIQRALRIEWKTIISHAGAIHLTRGGVRAAVVSVPCRYIHSPHSVMRLGDFEATVRLMVEFIRHCPDR